MAQRDGGRQEDYVLESGPAFRIKPEPAEPPDGEERQDDPPLAISGCQGDAWSVHGLFSNVDIGLEVKQELLYDSCSTEEWPSGDDGPELAVDKIENAVKAEPYENEGTVGENEPCEKDAAYEKEPCHSYDSMTVVKEEPYVSDEDDVILVETEIPKIVISDDSDDEDVVVVDVKLVPSFRSFTDSDVRVKQESEDPVQSDAFKAARRSPVFARSKYPEKPRVSIKTEPLDEDLKEKSLSLQGSEERKGPILNVKKEFKDPPCKSDDASPFLFEGHGLVRVKVEKELSQKPSVWCGKKTDRPCPRRFKTERRSPTDRPRPSLLKVARRSGSKPCPLRFKKKELALAEKPCPLRFKRYGRRSEESSHLPGKQGQESDEQPLLRVKQEERGSEVKSLFRVKAERKSEDGDDEARACLFGRNLEKLSEEEDAEEEAEDLSPSLDGITPARPSTTLYPAAKPSVDPKIISAMKSQSVACQKKWNQKWLPVVRLRRLDYRSLKETLVPIRARHPRRPPAPTLIEAAAMPKRRALELHRPNRESCSSDRGGSSSPPSPASSPRSSYSSSPSPTGCSPSPVKRSTQASSPKKLVDRRTSSVSSDGSESSSGSRARVAHRPPTWFHAEAPAPLSSPKGPPLHTSTTRTHMASVNRKQEDPEVTRAEARARDPRLKVKREDSASSTGGMGHGLGALSRGPAVAKRKFPEREEKPNLAMLTKTMKMEKDCPSAPAALALRTSSVSTNAAGYETRSPLYQEDCEPRKSYYSGMLDSTEGKGGVRSLSAPSWLDNALFPICKWKPSWLKTSKEVSRDKNPDLLPNIEDYYSERSTLQFPSVESYLHHFQSGLLLELWENIKRNNASEIYVAIDGAPMEKLLTGNKKRITLTCHFGAEEKKTLSVGDLVVISQVEKNKSDQTRPVFAYVETPPCYRTLSPTVKLSPILLDNVKKDSEPTYKVTFKVTFCICMDGTHSLNFEQPEEPQLLLLQRVKNIYEEIETFKFLHDFLNPLSNLAPLVLDPKYSARRMPLASDIFLKTAPDLNIEQRYVAFSVIQDIVDYETPSISIVEGGVGTGKTHFAAALAQELVELTPKHKRNCYVFIATKSNAELNIVYEKLKSRNLHVDSQNKDFGFRAIWLGSDLSVKGCDSLKDISVLKLANRYLDAQDIQSLQDKKQEIIKEIKRVDRKLMKLSNRHMNDPLLKSTSAILKRDLALINEKLEKNSEQVKKKAAVDSVVKNCDIFLTTLSSNTFRTEVQNALQKNHRRRVVLIVDNATEVTEPAIVKALVAYGITDVVLIGDHLQYHPFVPSRLARNAGLHVPLMERYLKALESAKSLPPYRNLTKQFRMQPGIFNSINNTYYKGTMALPTGKTEELFLRPYVWFNCTYFEETDSPYGDEVLFITNLLRAVQEYKLYKNGDDEKHIRIVSLNMKISDRLQNSDISKYCDLPDHLSSKECDVMIVSVGPLKENVRSDRLLLSLTRARKSIFICGNFSQDSPRKILPLLKDAKHSEVLEDIVSVPNDNISFQQMLMLKIRL